MSLNSPKKLFKVASEYNVSTQSIVDALSEKGYAVANRPNSSITPEMLIVLDEIYGVDKAKNIEYDRHREEYETRRTQILTGKDETISAGRFSEPSLEPSLTPLEPGLEPIGDGEPGLVPADELEPAVSSEPEEELDVQDQDLSSDEESTIEISKVPEQETVIDESLSAEVDISEESDKYSQTAEEEGADKVSDQDTFLIHTAEPEVEEIVRAKADKLKGTKILGKVQINRDEFPGQRSKPAAKRKRKKDRLPGEPPLTLETDSVSKKKKTKKIKIQEEEVQKAVRETMQAIQQGDSAGSKRAKRRKQRREERQEEAQLAQLERMIQQEGTIEVTEFVTVSDLAELLKVPANQVIMACMNIGQMVSINQRLDASTIELVAANFDREVIFVDAEDLLEESLISIEDDEQDLEPRAPIITVMGHVDHGKTSLLDYIRKAKVAAGEAGGITQHVGAYEVKTEAGKMITFLDTPGHEAFTAMRSRGAQATDIVILVVAADDSVMPQTIEAINHAKAAEVPIVVAINKVDKEGSNPDKIKQQLSEHGVIVEEWGGSNQSAEVSAKTGQGIDDLLDKVLIEAELMDLKANPERQAEGIVLEARIDKGKGIVANVLVQKGTLKVGDPFVAGPCSGRVRAMENEHSQRVAEAGPSVPVQLTGFDDIPQAGDRLVAIKDEKTAKEIANQRQQIKREQTLRRTKHLTLDDLSRRMALGEISELNIIIKADVDGSIEALSGSLQKLSTDEVAVNIIHTGSGAITESDVLLASASDAIIIGFQVRPTTTARKLAEAESIDVRLFSVIYDAIDEVKDALEGLLRPEIKEEIRGTADVREVFKIAKVGTIAGSYVIDGKIERNNPVRVIRDGIVIFNGQIDALKRFKDDVKEVATGYECGITVQNFNDLKVGDQIESYLITEQKRKLE